MTRQTENDTTELASTLREKLQRFVNELTPEELAYLRAGAAEAEPDELPPTLEAKAERAAEELTPEEEAQLQHLVQEALAGGADDTRGQMKPAYETAYGWKGRGPDPSEGQAGGSNLSGRGARFVENLQAVFGPGANWLADVVWPL